MLNKALIGRVGDWLLAAVLFVGWCQHTFRIIFSKLEWYDWVAYALPAANLVERGSLSTPQLGSQFHFDRIWLLNSPLLGAGASLFYEFFGTGRIGFLMGVLLFTIMNLAVFTWVIRRALKIESVALSLLASFAFMEHRNYISMCINQRYDIFAYAFMILAFMPISTKTLIWRWLCAGILPLIHPALIPASILWLAMWGVSAYRGERRADEVVRWRRWVGPILFATAWVMAAYWYGRIEGLRAQFLPHLRFHSDAIAAGSKSARMMQVAAGFPFSVPARAATLFIAATAFGIALVAVAKRGKGVSPGVLMPALMIIGVVSLDLTRGFAYWAFYLLGLAPCLLFAFGESSKLRRVALAAVLTLAVAHTSVSLWLDRIHKATLVGARESIAFLVEQSKPGEKLVLGPPFILASAPRFLPENRTVLRVVPQPFYLNGFDRDQFRQEVAEQGLTYIGEPRFFDVVTIAGGVGKESSPLVPSAEIHRANFHGEEVIIARPKR